MSHCIKILTSPHECLSTHCGLFCGSWLLWCDKHLDLWPILPKSSCHLLPSKSILWRWEGTSLSYCLAEPWVTVQWADKSRDLEQYLLYSDVPSCDLVMHTTKSTGFCRVHVYSSKNMAVCVILTLFECLQKMPPWCHCNAWAMKTYGY